MRRRILTDVRGNEEEDTYNEQPLKLLKLPSSLRLKKRQTRRQQA